MSPAARGILQFILQKLRALQTRRLFFILISLPLTLGILGYLIWRQRDILLSYRWTFRPEPALLAFGLYTVILFMTAWIWVRITESLGGQKISFWKHFRAFCISALGKRLPGTVWYIAWRAQIYGEDGYSARLVSLASGIEAAVSALSAVIVSLIFAIPILLQYNLSIWGLVIIFLISFALVQPRVVGWLRRRLGLEALRFRRRDLLFWTGAYVIIRILVGTMFFLVIGILYPLPAGDLPYVIGSQALVAGLAMFLFFFPSNFGFAEVSLSLLLSNIMPSSIAVVIVVLNRILVVFFEFVWSFVVVIGELIRKKRT